MTHFGISDGPRFFKPAGEHKNRAALGITSLRIIQPAINSSSLHNRIRNQHRSNTLGYYNLLHAIANPFYWMRSFSEQILVAYNGDA